MAQMRRRFARGFTFALPVAIAGALVLSGCQSSEPPDSDALGTTALVSASEHKGGLLAACPSDTEGSQRVRKVISSWYEVVRYLKECDLPRIRYYASDRNRDRILMSVGRLQRTSEGQCLSEANDVAHRFQTSVQEIQKWLTISWEYCMIDFRERLLDEREAELQRSLEGLSCRIETAFPELAERRDTPC